ncbi:MAG: MBL fold metallo-hydrolase [Anaerolineae bacterium]|nr:MBL fold metallo-hydrolase [Anaerolineae bacterium]
MDVRTITVSFILNFSVNCYLVSAGEGFVLVDTGVSNRRAFLERELERAGCHPRDLNLIILTHGDFDHSGNAAYLRDRFQTKVAMHQGDLGFVERGDMFHNRKQPNAMVKALMGLFSRLAPEDRFTPDVYLEDGADLSEYGLDARVINVTGHSRGSLVILTGEGDLFCGDLIGNTRRPELWSIMDDREAARASVERLKRLPVRVVYPGHGKPFSGEELRQIGVR